DLAMQRYRGEIRPGDSFAVNRSDGALAAAQGAEQDSFAVSKDGSWWKVEDGETRVFSEPYADSEVVSTLKPGEEVKVVREFSYRQPPQRWLQIEKPVAGYIQSRNLAPSR
ncbi:MAG: hypothetical protein DCC75_06180, partial [Proteobacteria bacterium]